jgi:predicted DNA-binding protein
MKQLSFHISEEQINILKKQKQKTGVPISYQIRDAIDQYIKKLGEK